jgi:hypothetical protein
MTANTGPTARQLDKITRITPITYGWVSVSPMLVVRC